MLVSHWLRYYDIVIDTALTAPDVEAISQQTATR